MKILINFNKLQMINMMNKCNSLVCQQINYYNIIENKKVYLLSIIIKLYFKYYKTLNNYFK